jgi:hypothetical protein
MKTLFEKILNEDYSNQYDDYEYDFIDESWFSLSEEECLSHLFTRDCIEGIKEEVEDAQGSRVIQEREDKIRDGIRKIVQFIYSLKDEDIYIYRGLSLKEGEKLDSEKVGNSWTWDLSVAKKFAERKSPKDIADKVEKTPLVLKSKAGFDDILPVSTFMNYMQFSYLIDNTENEIVLKKSPKDYSTLDIYEKFQ